MKTNRKTWKRVLATLLLVVVSVLAVPNTANATVYPEGAIAVGIDVSIYQGDVDWVQVRNSGVSFAFIKAFETGYGVDKKFTQNITGAAAAGVRTGVYVFSKATNVQEAYNEAITIVNLVEPYTVSFPIAIDLESKVMNGLTKDQIAAIANTFCATIDSYGYTPIIYANKNWFRNRIGTVYYDRWVAMYATCCDYEYAPQVWQASSEGKIPGIKGNVDIDYLYKDYSYIIPNGFSTKGDGYVYLYKNYRYQRGWVDYNGLTYFCDAAGHLWTGWLSGGEGVKWYMGPDGYMRTGLQSIDGAVYYFGTDGLCRYGFQSIAGKTYLFDNDGKMTFGFVANPEVGTFYFGADGAMATGFTAIGDSVYYFDANGLMYTGIQAIGANIYYFANDGKMQVGWQDFGNGNKFYFDPSNGVLQKGLVADGEGLRYTDPETGRLVTGFVALGNNIYYFDPVTGLLVTNQYISVPEGTYAAGPDGVCVFYPGIFL